MGAGHRAASPTATAVQAHPAAIDLRDAEVHENDEQGHMWLVHDDEGDDQDSSDDDSASGEGWGAGARVPCTPCGAPGERGEGSGLGSEAGGGLSVALRAAGT